MPFAANPSRSNRVFRSIVAILCLTATLLIATPCNASAAPHHAASMTAAHCSACCPAAPISAAPLCCQANTEPAQPISVHSLPGAPPNLQAVTTPGITSPIATLIAPPAASAAPPPLLHPILRI
jgi:hypothetical protein